MTFPWSVRHPLGGLVSQCANLTLKGHQLSVCFPAKCGRVLLIRLLQEPKRFGGIRGIDSNEQIISVRSKWVSDGP